MVKKYLTLADIPKDQIESRECKHVFYTVSQWNDDDDLLCIKEMVHLKDGTSVPIMTFSKNKERPFGITKKKYQDHTDKKEVEYLDRLQIGSSTQRQLARNITRRLGYGNPDQGLRSACRSQYVYGADITSATMTKKAYQRKWPGVFKPNRVAVMDTETDQWEGDGYDPIISTITCKEKAIITIRKSWIAGIVDAENQIRKALNEHLGELIKARNIQFEIKILDDMGEMITTCIDRAHEWQPDFLTFWNMDYDATVVMETLRKSGLDPAKVLSDPRVPDEFKIGKYVQGSETKIKANGDTEQKAWYDRWHWMNAPASFVWVDSAAVYRIIRLALGKEPSYSLDYILKKVLGNKLGKLYFPMGDSTAMPGSIEWHKQMQRDYKINYIVYNVFDCLGVELLDEMTNDLNTQIGILGNASEYKIFNSNPKRNIDEFFFFQMGEGMMSGTLSDAIANDPLDSFLLGAEDWIIALPSHNVVPSGVFLIKDLPTVRSMINKFVSDADIGSTYPNGEIILNLSRMTTMMELGRIEGVGGLDQRLVGVNLTGGPVNAIEIMRVVMKAPSPWEVLESFEELEEEELKQAA